MYIYYYTYSYIFIHIYRYNIFICTHTYIYIYTHTHRYVHIYIHIYTHIFVFIYIHMNTSICIYVYICIYTYKYKHLCICVYMYILQKSSKGLVVQNIVSFIGLFCRISSLLQVSFAKETYNFIDPTDRSHPIYLHTCTYRQGPYGVALVSRIDKIIGLFCKRDL